MGSKIHAGAHVQGQVVAVQPVADGTPGRVSLRFDKIVDRGKTVSMVTDIRAVAGFMEVQDAGVPEESASEGTPPNWLTTTQIGGDS